MQVADKANLLVGQTFLSDPHLDFGQAKMPVPRSMLERQECLSDRQECLSRDRCWKGRNACPTIDVGKAGMPIRQAGMPVPRSMSDRQECLSRDRCRTGRNACPTVSFFALERGGVDSSTSPASSEERRSRRGWNLCSSTASSGDRCRCRCQPWEACRTQARG